MRGKFRTVEDIVAEIATGAHGIVTRRELLAEDVSRGQIERRVTKGLLIPQYAGVYRAGHAAESREADYMAATKAAEGVLFCRAAGHLLGLLKGQIWPPPEVLSKTERKIDGLRTRRDSNLDRRDTTEVRGIPCTTVPRTLVDLAAVLGDEDLALACHMAHVIYRVGPEPVERVLARMPRAKNARILRAVLRGDVKVILSKLEKGFIIVLKQAGLPLPETNRYTDGRYVDCRWPDKRVTVELNSYRFHNSQWAFKDGNERERAAYARKDSFRRYTWDDVFERPERMLAELRELLA
jgi:hypothetical protein